MNTLLLILVGFFSPAQEHNLLQNLQPLAQQCHARQAGLQSAQNAATAVEISNNAAIVTSLSIEQYEKIVNEIYLQTLALGSLSFSPAQEQQLLQIAALCPNQMGELVFRARALLGPQRWPSWSDLSSCGQVSAKNLGTNKDKEVVFEQRLVLYPNPANEQLHAIWNIRTGENFQIHITNMLGQRVIEKSISGNQTAIDINTLEPGMYIFSLYLDGQLMQSKPFSVYHYANE